MENMLVVDDELSIRNMIRTMLEDDYRIFDAADGVEALACCQENTIDIVITDLVMPGKNGIDLMIALKDFPTKIKVIAISGGGGIQGQFEYLTIARMIGADAILEKPFTGQQLKQLVVQVWERL